MQALFGLLLLAGLLILAVIAGSYAWDMAKDAPELAVPIATVLGASITAIYGKLMDRNREITSHQRESKSEIYDSFVHFFLTDPKQLPGSAAVDTNFNETHQKMLLWGSDEVIRAYVVLFDHVSRPNIPLDKATVDYFISLVLAMRKDLGYKNRKINPDDIFILLGKNSGAWELILSSDQEQITPERENPNGNPETGTTTSPAADGRPNRRTGRRRRNSR